MTDLAVSITALPPAPLHVLDLWRADAVLAERFAAAGYPLPPLGRAAAGGGLTLLRFEPTVWLVEGDPAPLFALIGDDGALTAIGGSVVRVQVAGSGWRLLLRASGLLDTDALSPGATAATVIDRVNVRLHVEQDQAGVVYVPASYAADMIAFWQAEARLLA